MSDIINPSIAAKNMPPAAIIPIISLVTATGTFIIPFIVIHLISNIIAKNAASISHTNIKEEPAPAYVAHIP